jgi:hypothetical protein
MYFHGWLPFQCKENLMHKRLIGIQLPHTCPKVVAVPSSILFLLSMKIFRRGMALSSISPDMSETKIRKKGKLVK